MNYLMLSVGRRGELMKDFRASMEEGSMVIGTSLVCCFFLQPAKSMVRIRPAAKPITIVFFIVTPIPPKDYASNFLMIVIVT